jgi:dsRNA-specific ribonuclease
MEYGKGYGSSKKQAKSEAGMSLKLTIRNISLK